MTVNSTHPQTFSGPTEGEVVDEVALALTGSPLVTLFVTAMVLLAVGLVVLLAGRRARA